ncbi:hypothetical protein VDT1_3519 [Vibrio sp. 16]|nr:hypothetical protein VDT1_3519 [Vibrio sp. 16]
MDTLPALLFSLFIIAPLLTLIHELGHAIPQLFWVKHVTISLGTPRRGFTIPMGRLTIITSATPFHRGFCQISSTLSLQQRAFVLLGGPLVSWGCYFLFSVGQNVSTPPFATYCLNFSATFSFLQALMTTIPWRYPKRLVGYSGQASDGLQLLKLLRST